MKSNVEMYREYQLNGITVIQRTKDGYFDLNALIHEYNNKRETKYLLKDFFVLPSIKRAINTIYRKEVIETDFSYNLLEINVSQKIYPSLNDNATLVEKISNNDNINKLAENYCKKKTKGKREGSVALMALSFIDVDFEISIMEMYFNMFDTSKEAFEALGFKVELVNDEEGETE